MLKLCWGSGDPVSRNALCSASRVSLRPSTYLLTYYFITHSLTHFLTHSLSHSLTHSLFLSLTHSLTHYPCAWARRSPCRSGSTSSLKLASSWRRNLAEISSISAIVLCRGGATVAPHGVQERCRGGAGAVQGRCRAAQSADCRGGVQRCERAYEPASSSERIRPPPCRQPHYTTR